MPTYVYECRTCRESFEADQSIKDAPLTDCPCGGTVRRIIQPVGIAFKGSGFYVNDSVPAPAAKTEEKPSEKPAETAAPAETSGGKPEAPATPAASETKSAATTGGDRP